MSVKAIEWKNRIEEYGPVLTIDTQRVTVGQEGWLRSLSRRSHAAKRGAVAVAGASERSTGEGITIWKTQRRFEPVQWLYTRKPVKTFQIKGLWLDIGSKETLEKADRILASPR